MFEFFFDYDSFDFADILTVAAPDPITDVPTGSDTSVTTVLDAGSVPPDPVDPGATADLIPTDPTTLTDTDPAPVTVQGGSGADGDVAITLDDFSLFSVDFFA